MGAINPLLVGIIVGMVIILLVRQPSSTVIMPNEVVRPQAAVVV